MENIRILCYNTDVKTVNALTHLVSRLGVKVVSVPVTDHYRPIAAVISGISVGNAPVSPAFNEAMAVFVNMPDGMLDVVLGLMREKGIKIPLKAILTPHNAVWDANTLYKELCRERKEFSRK